jgi:PAS domain S-box-containing protein
MNGFKGIPRKRSLAFQRAGSRTCWLLWAFIGLSCQLKAGVILNREEREFLKKNPVITFVSQEKYAPFEFLDAQDQSSGICVELVRWLGSELGFTPRFSHQTFSAAQESVLEGKADVLTSLFYSEERKKYFDFTTDFVDVPASIFVSIHNQEISTLSDLNNKSIAMQRGDYAEEFLRNKKISARIIYTKDFSHALDMVLSEKADALIGDEQIVLYEAYGAKLNTKFHIVGQPLYKGKNCMATAKGNTVLLQILNKGIAEARSRGVMDQIYRKWIGSVPPIQESFFDRYRSQLILGAVTLIALLLSIGGWNIQLRRVVNRRTEEVKKRELAYRALTENSMDLIVRHDSMLQIIYVNIAAARFVDKRVRELQQVSLRDAGFSPRMSAEWEEGVRQVFATGVSRRLLLESVSEDKKLWLDSRLVPEFGAKNHVETVLSTCRDITETKLAEEARLLLESQLRQAQKLESLGVMAGGIAHDFNNLLTIIRGNVDLALMETSQRATSFPFLQSIAETTQRAADLCSQLLAYTGKAKFVTRSIDLNKLLHDTTHLLEVSLAKRAALEMHLHAALPLIQGDITQLQQILMNLTLNAAEAVEEKRGLVTIETGCEKCSAAFIQSIDPGTDLPEGSYVYFKIRDNGCGMDDDTMHRIFDPFFTTKFTGRGLGLAAALGIVKSHGGFLRVQSRLGLGSEFTVWLPVISHPPSMSQPPEPESLPLWRGEGKVLLADDELPVQRVTCKLLEKAGFDVVLASDGRQALELFRDRTQQFSFVLLDLTMPEMDGIEAMRKMRELCPDVKIILSSGYHELETKALLQANELPTAFLEKPYSFTTLLKTLKETLET